MKRWHLILCVLLIAVSLFFFQPKFSGYAYLPSGFQGCTESDGGMDYYLQGIVEITPENFPVDLIELYDDWCQDDSHVVEYACDADFSYAVKIVFCPNGCENGACV